MKLNYKEIIEWGYCIVIAIVLALLVRYFIGTPTIVKMVSMYPTLVEGDRLILNRWNRTTGKEYKRGDIITFEAPTNKTIEDQSNPVAVYANEPKNIFSKFVYYVLELNKMSYIKRVIALEGEHVEIKDGKVYINGKELQEDYLKDDVITSSTGLTDFIVPKGYIFAMGDNRPKSTDCRAFGCIPVEKVEGKVVFRFWPIKVFGTIK